MDPTFPFLLQLSNDGLGTKIGSELTLQWPPTFENKVFKIKARLPRILQWTDQREYSQISRGDSLRMHLRQQSQYSRHDRKIAKI